MQSVSVGPVGQLVVALTVDNQPMRRGSRKPRLILPVGLLDIGDEEKLT